MKRCGFHRREASGGFTLIELLIVVAIIAILAAIAVPNFLEAQVRSKVSRTKADMRTIATGMESYFVDYNSYPLPDHGFVGRCFTLSTPVAYLTTVGFLDPFCVGLESRPEFSYAGWATGTYGYICYSRKWAEVWSAPADPATGQPWYQEGATLRSWGPDQMYDAADLWPFYYNHPTAPMYTAETPPHTHWMDWLYDPTNGTKSRGDILRVVGNLECPQTAN
jgi:prepilin-type N-terminal cleavage/methylation domain-containing protein